MKPAGGEKPPVSGHVNQTNLDEAIVTTRQDCHHCRADSYAFANPLETTNWFRIVADVHPLIKGHILIIPRQHISCMGALPRDQFAAFIHEYHQVEKFLKQEYGSFAAFEHGVIGQTIRHAHFHLLPYDGDTSRVLLEKDKFDPIESIGDLPQVFRRDKHYLFFHVRQKSYLVDLGSGQPGFFRHRFAAALGNSVRAQQPKNPNVAYTGSIPPDDLMAQFKNDAQQLQKRWQIWTNRA